MLTAILSQIRNLDVKRIERKFGKIDVEDFLQIQIKIRNTILNYLKIASNQ